MILFPKIRSYLRIYDLLIIILNKVLITNSLSKKKPSHHLLGFNGSSWSQICRFETKPFRFSICPAPVVCSRLKINLCLLRQKAPLKTKNIFQREQNAHFRFSFCPAPGLRGTCHKPNRPRRQRAPSRPIRLMPPASEQSPSAFLVTSLSHTASAPGFLRSILWQRFVASKDLLAALCQGGSSLHAHFEGSLQLAGLR
jgi:hypothetical protein